MEVLAPGRVVAARGARTDAALRVLADGGVELRVGGAAPVLLNEPSASIGAAPRGTQTFKMRGRGRVSRTPLAGRSRVPSPLAGRARVPNAPRRAVPCPIAPRRAVASLAATPRPRGSRAGNTGLLQDHVWPYSAHAGPDGAVLLVLRRHRLHDALRGRRDLARAVASGFLRTYGRRALHAFGVAGAATAPPPPLRPASSATDPAGLEMGRGREGPTSPASPFRTPALSPTSSSLLAAATARADYATLSQSPMEMGSHFGRPKRSPPPLPRFG